MGSLKKCIKNYSKSFSGKELKMLNDANDKYLAEGKSDIEAGSLSVEDFYKYLQESFDGLKQKAGVTKEKVVNAKVESAPETKKESPKTTPVTVKGRKVEDIEISRAERDNLLASEYDNATIDKAVKEANSLRKLPAKELFNKLKDKGIFNLGITGNLEFRPNVGLTAEEYKSTLKQLEAGKETKTFEKLMNFIEDIKETGQVSMIGMTGGKSEKYNMPLHQFILENTSGQERGLSAEEEAEKLAEEEARLAYESQLEKGAVYNKRYTELTKTEKEDQQFYTDLLKLKGSSAKVILQKSREHIKDKGVLKMLDAMIKNSSKIDSLYRFNGFKNLNKIDEEDSGPLGIITGDGNIFLDDDIHKHGRKDMAEVLVHEYMHAFTLKATSSPKTTQENEFNKRINSIYDKLKKDTDYPSEYGFTNIDEFVSEISSNPDFVNKLRNNNKSLFKQIIDAIKWLLGLENNSSLVDDAIYSILKFIKESNPELFNESRESRRKAPLSDSDKKVKSLIDNVSAEPDLSKYSYEELMDVYNAVLTSELPTTQKTTGLNDVMVRIAMNIFDRQVKENQKDPKFNIETAVRKDISYKDVKMKVLSHFTDEFPTLQFLSTLWNDAYFNKTTQSREQKKTNEKLAIAVIKDRNEKLGIVDRVKEKIQSLYSNINHKYFDFMDNGKGELLTIEEAKKKNLSEPQIAYLKYVRELIAKRKGLIEDPAIYDMDMEVLRLDKGFAEAYSTEGLTQAFSNWIGNTHNIEKVRIGFTNPLTGKSEITEFGNIEKALVAYGKEGAAQKAKSLALMLKYNLKARRQLKKGINEDQRGEENVLQIAKGGEYTLDSNGQLQSKFSRKRDPNRAYSKDFYRAVQEYIDDSAHIENISPLIPVINSIEYLNKNGVVRDGKTLHADKKNVVQWLDEWTKLHVLKKPDEGIPELDMALRTLRFMTSATTMLFNVPANIMNVAIGNYNSWRAENSKTWAKGQARLFGGTDRKVSKDYGFGLLNKYAVDIVRKYGAVSTDVDSNPIQTAKNIFANLGFLGQKYGEFQIQGSGLLGLMSDEDYNSFEYKTNKYGVEELVVKKELNGKPVDEKALRKRILENIDRVSDVQGKYSDKDKRNIMNNELGKSALQFKVWIGDWWRIRYGDKGSWTTMLRGGFAELKNDMKEKGTVKAFLENKAFMSNLKGAMFTAMLMTLVYRDDDDKKKSSAAKMLEKALADVLFIFDPNNLKFTLTRPIASIGVIEKFIDLLDHLMAFEADDFYKGDAKYGDEGDAKVFGDVVGLTPGKKLADVADMLNGD